MSILNDFILMFLFKTHFLFSINNSFLLSSNSHDSNFKSSNFLFSSYLAGLFEGDGYIYVPQTPRDVHGLLLYPSIQLCFSSKDLPLALLIQKNLNCGSINKKKGTRAYLLTINNILGLRLFVSLVNGFMRTPKYLSLHNLIS
jgi:DNA-binding transcriptional regulator WhiA